MVAAAVQPAQINVLASDENWAWPVALRRLFEPRGINLLVAKDTDEFVNVLARKRIHTAIVDMDRPGVALATIKVIRMDFPQVPCVVLKSRPGSDLLQQVLQLDVFGVVDKPVDMIILQQLLNRLFIKRYESNIFAD